MNVSPRTIAILGSGVWGSTLGSIAKRNQHQVRFWSRRSFQTLAASIEDATLIISAVAMKGVLPTVDKLVSLKIPRDLIIVTATKGLDSQTQQTPSQIWQQAFPHNPIVVLSGPNLSAEIARELPAATVVASRDAMAARTVQEILASDLFRVYLNQDPIGTELGGTLKNIIAIAAGVSDGMELGINAKSALLTRALPEIVRVGAYLGGSKETFFGLSGLGDLIATCDSPLSRNYQVGYGLARGKTLEQILAELKGTAEGINTTEVLMKIAETQKISVPITHQVYRLLQGKITPKAAIDSLMARDLKPEFCDLN